MEIRRVLQCLEEYPLVTTSNIQEAYMFTEVGITPFLGGGGAEDLGLGDFRSRCREKASGGCSLPWVYLPTSSLDEGGSILGDRDGKVSLCQEPSKGLGCVVRALGLRDPRGTLRLSPTPSYMLSLCFLSLGGWFVFAFVFSFKFLFTF